MSHIVVVDDRSERVKYYGPWTHDTVGDDAWDATLSIASEKGAGAVFEFYGEQHTVRIVLGGGESDLMRSTGTYVNVNGGILLKESAGPVPPASFAVDGGEPHTFTAPDSFNATWNNTLYGSDALADGSHTLNITLLGSGSPWLFDVFLYNGTEEATTTTTTAVATKTAAVTEQLIVVNTVVATPSASIATPPAAASRAAVPVGPIVGGIVGGVTLLVCAAMAFYFLYWKRRTRGRPYYYERTEKADLFDTGAVFSLSPLPVRCIDLFLQRTSSPPCTCTTTSARRRRARRPSHSLRPRCGFIRRPPSHSLPLRRGPTR